jgi:hypothetical protein
MPSNGRGIHPRVDASTFAHWHFDDVSTSPANDSVLNQRPLTAVAAIPLPTLTTGRIGRARSFTGTQLLGRSATAADMTFAQGTWTISVWVRMLSFPGGAGASVVIVALGGRDGVDGGVADDNVQFAFELVRDASVVPYPGANGEVRARLFWEDGAGVDHSALVTTVDFRRFLGRWILLTWRKSVGAPFTYECLVNGRVVQTFTAQANSSSAALATQRWTVGGVVNATGILIARGITGHVCSWHAQSGVMSNPEVEEIWRRGAGLALPTAQYARLFVQDQSAVYRDLTDPTVVGDDFVESVEYTTSIDDQTDQIVATMFRESGDISLAPLRGDSVLNNPSLSPSFTPFLGVWRPARLDAARVPTWITPTATDWETRFEGRIDEIDDGGERVTISCRDEGARMAERYINAERSYPATGDLGSNGCGPTAGGRETVMQRVIDDNGGAGAFGAFATLYTPIPTQSCMVPPTPDARNVPRGHLLPTLRTLAGQIGWDCRARWDPSTSLHRLTMFDPGRGRVDCDAVIAERDVMRTTRGAQDASGVRNQVTVTFPDRFSVGLPTDQGLASPNSVFVQNATSVAQFDLREMEVIEDQSSQIDTTVEASRMATAIVDDLAFPLRRTTHDLAGVPEIEAHDVLLMQPDGIRTTVNQEGAVRSVRHTFTADGCRTSLDAQGKPAAGFNRWLSIEAGRNGRPPIRNPGEALTGRGIGSLLPGLLDMVDRSIYLGGTKFVEVKNGDFARFSRGNAYPPDSWTMAIGTWGTDASAVEGVTLSGGRAVSLNTATATLRCQNIPILGSIDTPYSFEVHWQWPAPFALPPAPKRVELLIEWLAADGTTVVATCVRRPRTATTPPYQFPDAPVIANGTWFTSRVDGICPIDDATGLVSTARFVRIGIRADTDGTHAFPTAIVVDTVAIYRTAREDRTFCLNPWVLPAAPLNAWYNVALRAPGSTVVFRTHDWGHNHFVSGGGGVTIPREDGTVEVLFGPGTFLGNGFYAKEPGTYLITAAVALIVNSTAPGAALAPMARIVRNATYTSLASPNNTGGSVIAQANGGVWVPAGTYDPLLLPTFANHSVSPVLLSTRAELQRGDRLTLEWFRANLGPATIFHLGDTTGGEARTWWNVRLGLAE